MFRKLLWYQSPFIRSFDSEYLLENFLVSAVTSILFIRFFLKITNYPHIGGASFHIAHMLWGGFLMMIAIVLLLAYLNRPSTNIAAVIGGIGFGTFIDELGKFITSDNNYFYQPTVALLYIIFILMYLTFRLIDRHRTYTSKEYIVNSIEMLKEAVLNDMDIEEKRQALYYLSKSDQRYAVVKAMEELIQKSEVVAPSSHPFMRLKLFLRSIYNYLIAQKWFAPSVIAFFILQTVAVFVNNILVFDQIRDLSLYALISVVIIFTLFNNFKFTFSLKKIFIYIFILFSFVLIAWRVVFNLDLPQLSVMQWGRLVSSILSSILVLTGILNFYTDRLLAYRLFKRSVLVSIFLTQFFLFYKDQFSALLGLFFNILILITLDYIINQEKSSSRKKLTEK